jgi:glycosyltransferase involved in cell wall biosynthesis
MIGLFNDCYPPVMDGVSVAISNYAYWLHEHGCKVCVVTPTSPQPKIQEVAYPIYRYWSLPIPKRKPYRLGIPEVDFSFSHKIDNLSFQLLHAHCPFSSGQIALKIARKRKIPLVATFHSKYREDFERLIPSKIVVDTLMKRVIDFYDQADEVWVPQLSVEETLRSYGYKGNIEVVDNGNDLSMMFSAERKEDCREKIGIKPDEFMLLFVGQHILEKNVMFLIESLNLMQSRKFHLYFVGSGYALREMKQKVEQLGLNDKVTFVGSVTDRQTLSEYYMASDLFLFPSLYDNAPLVVREAAAMNTPSLLIEGSTAAGIIDNNVNGFLSKNDRTDFAERIVYIMNNPTLADKAGKAASCSIVRSWNDILSEVEDRYNHLLKRME